VLQASVTAPELVNHEDTAVKRECLNKCRCEALVEDEDTLLSWGEHTKRIVLKRIKSQGTLKKEKKKRK